MIIIKEINLTATKKISTRYKKTVLVDKLGMFLSQSENQHFIKQNSSLLGIDNRKTIRQRYKISKNKKYKRKHGYKYVRDFEGDELKETNVNKSKILNSRKT